MKKLYLVIYIYTDFRNYKIGKAARYASSPEEAAKIRISEQTTAAIYGSWKLVDVLVISREGLDPLFVEAYIHNRIEEMGYERLYRNVQFSEKDIKEGLSEWFNFRKLNEFKVKRLVRQIFYEVNHASGQKFYIPRFYQALVKAIVLDKIESGLNESDSITIALELAPRFGKTLWALDLFNELRYLGINVLILPTFVLSSTSSFTKEITSFGDFEHFYLLDSSDEEFDKKIKEAKESGKTTVIGVSMHMSENSLKKYKKSMSIIDKDKIMSIVDEADFGAHTESSRRVLNAVKSKITLLMTGTAIERAIKGLIFIQNNIVIWTQTDMQMVKKGTHPILQYIGNGDPKFSNRVNNVLKKYTLEEAKKSCANLPEIEMLKLNLSNISALQEIQDPELKGKWSKILADVNQNKSIIKTVYKGLFDFPNMESDNPDLKSMSKVYLRKKCKLGVTMIFGGFPNKKQQKDFVKILQNILGDNFEVYEINGDVTTNKKAEKKAIGIINRNRLNRKDGIEKQIIFVSKDMASRSFSIPEIDTVILMYDRGMINSTSQKISRAFTPGNNLYDDEKLVSHVVSLSLDASREHCPIDLYIIQEAARIGEYDPNGSIEGPIKNVASCYNVFQNTDNGFLPIEIDEYSKFLLEGAGSDLLRIASSTVDVSDLGSIILSMDQEMIDFLDLASPNGSNKSKSKGKTEISIKDVKTYYDNQRGPNDEKIKTFEEKLSEVLRDINYCVPQLVLFDDYVHDNIEDIINSLYNQPELYKEIEEDLGFSIVLAKYLLPNLNHRLLNTAIGIFIKEEEKIFVI